MSPVSLCFCVACFDCPEPVSLANDGTVTLATSVTGLLQGLTPSTCLAGNPSAFAFSQDGANPRGARLQLHTEQATSSRPWPVTGAAPGCAGERQAGGHSWAQEVPGMRFCLYFVISV